MSNFADNPVKIGLSPASERDSLYGGHVLSLGRGHGEYRHVLSGEELDRLEASIRAYRQTVEGSAS